MLFMDSNIHVQIPAGKHLMELVAVDWFKDVKRMDHVARRKDCAVQVSRMSISDSVSFMWFNCLICLFVCFFGTMDNNSFNIFWLIV